jgi:hypothetical protein
MNPVFEFVSTEFRPSSERKKFVRSQVRGPLLRLLECFQSFSEEELRKAVEAKTAGPACGDNS